MKVWIDQDLCTGDALCTEIAPAVFKMGNDNLSYVMENGVMLDNPGGSAGIATIPDAHIDAVIEAAEECPGECIFIEA